MSAFASLLLGTSSPHHLENKFVLQDCNKRMDSLNIVNPYVKGIYFFVATYENGIGVIPQAPVVFLINVNDKNIPKILDDETL